MQSGHCTLHTPTDNRPNSNHRGYDSAWRTIRAQVLLEEPACTWLMEDGSKCGSTARPEVDHKDGNPWNRARPNLRRLCKHHHSAHTARHQAFGKARAGWKPPGREPEEGFALALPQLQPSRIPLTIVYGPPASGKSTYVSAHASPTDLIIDLDPIKQELSGLPWYDAGEEWVQPALIRRNELLSSLSATPTHTAAWFIVTAPWASHRRKWAEMLQPVRTVMLDVPAHECIARVKADPRRTARVADHTALIHLWWERYTADPVWKRAQGSVSPQSFVIA